MARNESAPLSLMGLATIADISLSLWLAEGEPVTLEFVKRDGTGSTATGAVLDYMGDPAMDTFSVVLDTVADKGRPTTVNLCRVTALYAS